MLNPRACGDPGGMDCQTFENLYQVSAHKTKHLYIYQIKLIGCHFYRLEMNSRATEAYVNLYIQF